MNSVVRAGRGGGGVSAGPSPQGEQVHGFSRFGLWLRGAVRGVNEPLRGNVAGATTGSVEVEVIVTGVVLQPSAGGRDRGDREVIGAMCYKVPPTHHGQFCWLEGSVVREEHPASGRVHLSTPCTLPWAHTAYIATVCVLSHQFHPVTSTFSLLMSPWKHCSQ